ncbi:MAG: TIGR03667 family PPOX class F420-dependent oxidoreductase [Chloroflexi bacterium]|nr:TIGR03667 family PPOX class F420-dependent oxidoreductase [Chloroflexota bacterium]
MLFDLQNAHHAHANGRLRREPIIWLSTVRRDGRPHLVPVWFLWDGATILIFSQPDAQKIRNLRASPHVCLALEAAADGGDVVILEGVAAFITLRDAEPAFAAFTTKYGEHMARMGWTLETMLADYSLPVRVTPTRLIAWR